MTINDFLTLLFDKAKNGGFAEYEANYSAGKSFFVNVQGGEPEKYTVNSFVKLTFKAKRDGRIAYATTTALEPDAADFLVDQVSSNLSVLTSNDESFIFEGSESYAEVNEYSPELDAVSDADKIELARRIEAAAMAKPGIVRVMHSVVAYTQSENAIRNSKGLDLHSKNNYVYAYCIPIASDGKVANNGMEYIFTKDISAIDPEELGGNAAQKALDALHPAKVKTGSYRVVFGGECFGDLMATFSGIFSADAAQKGISLLAGKEGTKVASDCVTLCDDALSPLAPMHDAYDDEGVATVSKQVIKDGVLTTLLYNLKTANKAGCQSTGNASGNSVSPNCMFITPSDKTQAELFAMTDNGIYLTELNGLHSGANPASGDFSLSAKGYRIAGDQKGEAVSDFIITGNFYSLLKNILAVSDRITWGLPPQFGAPDILVDNVMISGE